MVIFESVLPIASWGFSLHRDPLVYFDLPQNLNLFLLDIVWVVFVYLGGIWLVFVCYLGRICVLFGWYLCFIWVVFVYGWYGFAWSGYNIVHLFPCIY